MGVLAQGAGQSLEERQKLINSCADQLAQLGVFNMLLSDGDRLYVYCSTKLYWVTRRAPFGEEPSISDVVTVVATEPLTTNESWVKMKPGELGVFEKGDLCSSEE